MSRLPEARLAVLGSPIAHSLSPALHAAAYARLGLDWEYGAVDVPSGRLADFLSSCDASWRGLSLTMPLKREVFPLLDTADDTASLTGVANTLLFDGDRRRGFNTDVAGIVRAFQQNGVDRLSHVVILGGGATAASAIVAAHELGARSAQLWLRTPAKASGLRSLATELGIELDLRSFTEADAGVGHPDAVISTLPNGTQVDLMFSAGVRADSVLFDVAYDPWPTPLAASWAEAGGRTIAGIDMLIHQAVVQVRIFTTGRADRPLPDESRVLAAMQEAVGR